MLYPCKNPFSAVTLQIPTAEDGPQGKPISWKERGIGKQDLPWVRPGESLQWSFTKKLIELLRSRDNKVFVLVGPFNPYVLTQESLARYTLVRQEMEGQLEALQVSHFSVPALPSQDYADASHPLKEGYREMAEELRESKPFQEWIKQSSGGAE